MGFSALIGAAVLTGTMPATAREILQRQERAMGPVTVTLVVRGDADPARALAKVWKVMDRVEAVMNEWRADSPLSKLNRKAGDGQWVTIPRDLYELLEKSLEATRLTDGRFDPTWASLKDLWRFGTDRTGEVPAEEQIRGRCANVGMEAVELRVARGLFQARISRKGTQIGLGGAAKGWAVDRAVDVLRAHGFRDFWIQAGGDLYAAGEGVGGPWVVGIRDPRGDPEDTFAAMPIRDAAFSTSGDYERFFIKDGVRYHHLIDPTTCRPAGASRSASVRAKTALEAEFLTKTAFIAGGTEGLALIDRFGAAAVIVDSANEVHVSESVRGAIEIRPPTP